MTSTSPIKLGNAVMRTFLTVLAVMALGIAAGFLLYPEIPWPAGLQMPALTDGQRFIGAGVAGTFGLVLIFGAIAGPRFMHRQAAMLEPGRGGMTIAYGFLGTAAGAVCLAAVLYPTDDWPTWADRPIQLTDQQAAIAALVSFGLAVLLLLAAAVNGYRWRIAHVVRRMSNDPRYSTSAEDVAALPQPGWPGRGPSRVVIEPRNARQFRRVSGMQKVSGQRNVIGGRPLMITYLRLFENFPRTQTFARGAWREFGHVHLLRSAESVTPNEYRQLRRSGDPRGVFISSPQQLEAALTPSSYRALPAGRRPLRTIANRTVRVWDRFGSYQVHALLCHGSYWRPAVDKLLQRSGLVVMDLSGLMNGNVGTRYEMQRVIDQVPLQRIVFIADARTNVKFLRQHITRAWQQMSAGSPNAAPGEQHIPIYITDYFVETRTSNADGSTSQGQTRLRAKRSQTRRLVAGVINQSKRSYVDSRP